MDAPAARFLSAQWLNLAVVNFEIDAAVLVPHVPVGTELDTWQGRSLVSLVGFQFRDTRVWGLSIPFHRHFAEVNLRFYVRRKTTDGWRRGVSFIRELAPRRALAWTARVLYGENYQSVPIRCDVTVPNGDPRAHSRVAYQWRYAGQDSLLELTATGTGATAREGTLEAFIIEHYWGYSGGAGRRTIEYQVEHPPWKLWPTSAARFDGDAIGLYGPRFAEALAAPPVSAFFADGSAVSVFRGRRIA